MLQTHGFRTISSGTVLALRSEGVERFIDVTLSDDQVQIVKRLTLCERLMDELRGMSNAGSACHD
jgi:hypothetical protein